MVLGKWTATCTRLKKKIPIFYPVQKSIKSESKILIVRHDTEKTPTNDNKPKNNP
jgi:hypothetical protein